jgi:metal-responsive CopG/Arc/MetJ family transcriptional regulator
MLLSMDTELNISNTPPAKSPSQRRVTSIALTDELIARLDRYASQAKVSRSWIIVRVLEGWLESQESADD